MVHLNIFCSSGLTFTDPRKVPVKANYTAEISYMQISISSADNSKRGHFYLLAGTTAISQPRAEATFNNVSSWGVAFLLSKRAITDCVKLDALASSFCVIPLLCLCSIRLSIIRAQLSGIENTPHRFRTFV